MNISSNIYYFLMQNKFLFNCLLIITIIIINIDKNFARVVAKNKYCADINCKVPIGSGKTKINYQKIDDLSISFKSDSDVTIYGKTDDNKHFYVEINGKRGFAPSTHILEEKVFLRNPEFSVQISNNNDSNNNEKVSQSSNDSTKPVKTEEIIPDKVSVDENEDEANVEDISDNIEVIEETKVIDNKNSETDSNLNSETMEETKTHENINKDVPQLTQPIEKLENSSESEKANDFVAEQSDSVTKVFSSLMSDEDIKESVTPASDGVTVVDGTTFLAEDLVFDASPTIQTEPATATKTATIALTLDDNQISSDTEFNAKEAESDEQIDNKVKEEVKQVEEPSILTGILQSVFPFGGGSDVKDIISDDNPESVDLVENSKEDNLTEIQTTDQNSSDNQQIVVDSDVKNNSQLNQTLDHTKEFNSSETKQTDESLNVNHETIPESDSNTDSDNHLTNENLSQTTNTFENSSLSKEAIVDTNVKNDSNINQTLDHSANDISHETRNPENSGENPNVSQESGDESNAKIDSTINQTIDDPTNHTFSETETHITTDENLNNNSETIVESIPKTDSQINQIVDSGDVIVANFDENSNASEEAIIESDVNDSNINQTLNHSNDENSSENRNPENTDENQNLMQKNISKTDAKNDSDINLIPEHSTNETKNTDENVNVNDGDIVQTDPRIDSSNHSTDEVLSDSKNPVNTEDLIEDKVNIQADDKENTETISKLIENNDPFLTKPVIYNEDVVDEKIPLDYNNNEVIQSLEGTQDIKDEVNPDIVNNFEQTFEEKVVNYDDLDLKQKENIEMIDTIDKVIKEESGQTWIGFEGLAVFQVISDIIPDDIELLLKDFHISTHLVVFTSIIAFNWCLMKVLISVLRSSRKETELRDISCKAQRKMYYFEAEKQKLLEEMEKEREKALISEERMTAAEHKVIPVENEFRKLKTERDQLQQKVIGLESELETTSEACLELNKLLNDFMTSQKENINLNSSVEALQEQINKQSEIVAKYQSTAELKEKENKELKEELTKLNKESERLNALLKETEINLEKFQTNNEDLKAAKNELNSTLTQLQNEFSRIEKKANDYINRNDELLSAVESFRQEIDSLRDSVNNKDLEIESMKELLTNINKCDNNYDENDGEMNGEKSLNDFCDIIKIQTELKSCQTEKKQLNQKFEELSDDFKQLNNRWNSLESENKSLISEKESALQDRLKAVMELEVLSKYYKEKELELGKQIGVHQIQKQQREEDADSIQSQLLSLEEENALIKSQLKSMKKEVEASERRYKSQINQLEKQVHENWILARNSERKLEESKAEAAVLRQTLTMSAKSPIDGFGGDLSYMDDSASSISDNFNALPPPPPPPPLPPMIPLPHTFSSIMPPMMPFGAQELDPSQQWNQNMSQMAVRPHLPDFSQMQNTFSPISMANNSNMNYTSVSQSSYVPNIGQQWDTSSNRDTFSPANSHRSTSSPNSTYNMFSQHLPQSHHSNPIMSMSMNSPMNSTIDSHYSNGNNSSVNSPVVSSETQHMHSVLSNPVPQHWVRTSDVQSVNNDYNKMNNSYNQTNIDYNQYNTDYNQTNSEYIQPNNDYNHINNNYTQINSEYNQNEYNGSQNSSRPVSRNDPNVLHTSIV